ncbi:MAG: DUF4147 domain-containing protein [Candidatus Zambryskibacteria bacterium]|nr:DUF4147 domain-containing protein [Candidatus Zambryskibacteria bacterium]
MSIILNKKKLATNPLREAALDILEAGLLAIDTKKILKEKIGFEDGMLTIKSLSHLEIKPGSSVDINLKNFNRLYFIGIGKCALDGAKALEEILGNFLTEGIVIDVRDKKEAQNLKKIKYFQGDHPLPSKRNIEATKKVLGMVENLTEKDLIITLISGGGSALFELPVPGVPLDTLIAKTKELTAQGADIYELNKIRKELSQVKGGKFAQLCNRTKIISLIFSDVLGNDLSVIASGPTVLEEKDGRIQNILLLSNHDALIAMKNKAMELGFYTEIKTEKLSGIASEVGKKLAMERLDSKSCLLFGGETTVEIRGEGQGGRNQEMALSALLFIQPDTVLLCASSDGCDNTDFAGALVDRELFEKSKKENLSIAEFLAQNNSYNFFKEISDGGILTEKLGSNVSDLVIMLSK